MRAFIILSIFSLLTGALAAQVNCVSFSYDAYGNRTSKYADAGCNGELPPLQQQTPDSVQGKELADQAKLTDMGTTHRGSTQEAGERNATHHPPTKEKETPGGTIQVYPNPTREWLTITGWVSANMETLRIVSPSDGRIIKTFRVKPDGSVRIDLDDLAAGVYYLEFESQGIKETRLIEKL